MGKLATSIAVAMWALFALACAQPHTAELPPPLIDSTRMQHAQHAQVGCVECHRGNARPGQQDHEPCDRGDCHGTQFLAPPGRLCLACHTRVTARPLLAPLRAFPDDDAYRAEPSRFSHKLHMDAGRMESKTGFHVACADCHVDSDGKLAHPDHAACSRCHAAEVKLAGAPSMADCDRCHVATTRERVRRRLIRDDLKFSHDTHHRDRHGDEIRCEQCHSASATSPSYEDHGAPQIAVCVGCHDDGDRAPQQMRMRICETCHATRTSTLTAIAPRDHLPLTERPVDHTIAFRKDHAESAARDAVRCATCHTQMSGNAHDACDECHQTMTPADHRITWREYDHGPEAIADRTRCARCHVPELCTACHAQRPRSHGQFGTFVNDHAVIARTDIRPCITCHTPVYCATCHQAPASAHGSSSVRPK